MEWDKNDPLVGCRAATTRCACIGLDGKNTEGAPLKRRISPPANRIRQWRDEQNLIIGVSSELSNAHRWRRDNH
jgi:hypothetical protein